MTLKGLGTALVTPFKEGAVDMESYKRLLARQIEADVDFLVPLGSTAETPCLEDDEKKAILETTVAAADGRPVVVGVGTNSLAKTIRNIKMLEPYGPDAYLVVVPYYNKPTQEGMYQYFKAVAESTDKGIVLYNVPGRTGSNMKAETTLRLAEIPNIIAVKEASGDAKQILDIVNHAPEGFTILSGNDDQTYELMEGGAHGLISVASNIAPAQVKSLVHALLDKDLDTAKDLDKHLQPLFHDCFVESNPIPVKGGLSLMGLCRNEFRLPLTPATPATLEIMKRTISNL